MLPEKLPAYLRFPVAAFLGQPIVAKPLPSWSRRECGCGAQCSSTRCDRCSKRATREFFLAKWDARPLDRGLILDALLADLGWVNRNYDFSEERQAFLAALEDGAEPEVFRQILAEGGLEEVIEERDGRRQRGLESARATHKAYWRAQTKSVPALVLTAGEARIHATELLAQPARMRWSHARWAYQDEIYLQVLCIAGSDIERAGAALGRTPEAVAWRAADAGMTLPPAWRKLTASKTPRKPAEPRWVPMAYPYVSAKRAENAQVMEVNRLVAEYLPGRADICQEILLALWEKKVTMDELRKQGKALRSFVRQFYKTNHEMSGYARSLDAPLTRDSEFSLMDTISTEDGLWS